MPNNIPNSTNYVHSNEPNLVNLHKALEYNTFGQPVLRTVAAPTSVANSSVSAFGEPYAVEISPVFQVDAIYGINPNDVTAFTFNSGVVSTSDSRFVVTSTPDTFPAIGVCRSRRFIRYRPGQGALARFACAFSEGVAGTEQRAGMFSYEEAFQIGYNGTEFGILHQRYKKMHIEKFTINTPPSGSETISLTLDGVVHTVSINATTSASAASQISANFNNDLWLSEAYDNEITFVYLNNGAPTSTFNISSTGSLAGTTSTLQESNIGIEQWIPQSEWNGDKCDGTGASGVVINPSFFNVFQINFRWLGAGRIHFSMENPITGGFINLHTILWTNKYQTLHTHNPSFSVGFQTYNLSGASPITIYGGSIMGAIEGKISQTKNTASASTTKKNLSSGQIHHLGTLKNPFVHNNQLNAAEITIKNFSVAFQGNDPLEVFIFINIDISIPQLFENYPSVSAKASLVAGTIANTNMPVTTFILPINGNGIIDLELYNLLLIPGSTLSVGVRSNQSISQIAASITWIEE